MPTVDRDLEEIVEFCKRFSQNLSDIDSKASDLNRLGGKIESALYNTRFATNASSTVSSTAKKVQAAVAQGEQRIREIQRRAEVQIEERNRFDR